MRFSVRATAIMLSALVSSFNFSHIQTATAQDTAMKPSDIPVERFAELPAVSQLRQSPNGEKVAFLSSIEGRKVMIVQNLDGSDRYIQPPIEEADIYSFVWANEDRLLVMYELTVVRSQYVNFRNTETRLAAVNADGSDFAWIVRPSKVKNSAGGRNEKHDNPMWQTEIIDMLPEEPNHILLSIDGDFNSQDEIRRIDIRNGRFRELEDGFRGVQHWKTDAESEPRFGWGVWEENRIAYWKNLEGGWEQISNADWYSRYGIYGFDETPDHLIVSARSGSGTEGLYRLNIPSGQIVDTILDNETSDIDRIVMDRDSGRVVGASYVDTLRRYHYFDRKRAGLLRAMQKALPDYEISIEDFDHAAGRYLLLARTDQEPGVYFQYDRKAKSLAQVTATRPAFPSELSAPTQEIKIAARDGTEIPVFVTTPNGMDAQNLPAVVLVHGGPHARDDAEWDWWAQFLASRGYVVIKPNFRGSEGYGPAFMRAGYGEWSGLMQTDVTDATQYFVDKGVIDANRICIAGASYGGYAAMIGVIQEPELYQCGVTVNGANNIPRLKTQDAAYWGTANWRNNIGLEGHSDEDISPFHQAKKITKPVLVMASKDDTRIRIVDSENFHSRLKSLGKNTQFVEISDGGHSMDTMNARMILLREMETFLSEHIGE